MRNSKAFFLFMLLAPTVVFCQGNRNSNVNAPEKLLQDPSLPPLVKMFANHDFKPTDDSLTEVLLDTLTAKNEHFYPLYVKLFNEIVIKSDGALSEIMGDYCFKILVNYPGRAFNLLIQDTMLMNTYTLFLGYEFYMRNQKTSDLPMGYKEFKKYMARHLDLRDEKCKVAFSAFCKKTEEAMSSMN